MLSRISVGLIAAACTLALPVASSASTTAAPVSFVFFSTAGPAGCVNNVCKPALPYSVYALAVSSNGEMKQVGIASSPTIVFHLSVTKKFLFGIDDASNIYTYSIAATGALKLVATTHAGKYVSSFYPAHSSTLLQVDETGTTLYCLIPTSQTDRRLASFRIESNGELQFLGTSHADSNALSQIRFVQDNRFALMDGCYNTAPGASFTTDSNDVNDIVTYKRESNGYLTYIGTSHDTPAARSPYEYCAGPNASDPTDHLAILFSIFNPPGDDVEPGFPLASYIVNSKGEPSTNNDYENMPVTNMMNVNVISIDPTGKLLAVGGEEALQFYHFNGGNPITTFGSQIDIPNYQVMALGWDKSSHFFFLTGNQVEVYHITPAVYTKLAPWDVPSPTKNIPYNMIVRTN
jgi:hypothetical protein